MNSFIDAADIERNTPPIVEKPADAGRDNRIPKLRQMISAVRLEPISRHWLAEP